MKQEVEIVVPKDWSAITLRKYLELKADIENYEDNPDAVEALILHHLCGVKSEWVQRLDVETFSAIRRDINGFMKNVELPLQRFITIDGVLYGFEPNLSKMEYGAYLDISKYESLEIDGNWAEIMSILYRPVTNQYGKFYDIKSYDGTIDKEMWLDVTMDYHWGAVFFFQTFIGGLIERYPEIFDGGISGDITQHQINFSKKWKSYSSIVQLANENILMFDEVVKQPLEKCLLYLCYLSDKSETEERVHKEMMKRIKP